MVDKHRRLNRSHVLGLLRFFVLLFLGITMVFPFVWMISTSLKTFEDIYTVTPTLIPRPALFERYLEVWSKTDLLSGFKNSLMVAVPVMLIGSFTSSLAAFAFSKLRLPKGNLLFMLLLSTIMLPFAAVMIPQFILFTRIGWTDSLLPLIIPGLFGNVGMIFFLRQFMAGVPDELFDSGRIDGCSPFGLYLHIMLPIARPAIAVQVILWFMGVWNDFLGPIIYINSPEKMTVQAVIATLKSQFVSQTDMGMLMTASVLAVIPILLVFLLFQRQIVDAQIQGGIKG